MQLSYDREAKCLQFAPIRSDAKQEFPYLVKIQKGGELFRNPDNTFGFELEFCSHDSDIFSYTHIKVCTLYIGKDQEWAIESDANQVFELTTAPVKFISTIQANDFKSKLARLLVESLPVDGSMLFESWIEKVVPKIRELLNNIKPGLAYSQNEQALFKYNELENVRIELNEKNIDMAGHYIRRGRDLINSEGLIWNAYMNNIKLYSSKKDVLMGFSSQVNMPMTLGGFFIYSFYKLKQGKIDLTGLSVLTDLRERRGKIEPLRYLETENSTNEKEFLELVKEERRSRKEMKASNAYWRAAIWAAFISLLGYDPEKESRAWTSEELNQVAATYLVANKLICGAIGGLSENLQLDFQRHLWKNGEEEDWKGAPDDSDIRNYHSQLKSLTGLWFKCPLIITLNALNLCDTGNWRNTLSASVASHRDEKTWRRILAVNLSSEQASLVDYFASCGREQLIAEICRVAGTLEKALKDTRSDINLASMDTHEEVRRSFLMYNQKRPWEGRYDTMYPPITRDDGRITFLVEHRHH